jgi:glycerophosphoryl diester phosphodiesterase
MMIKKVILLTLIFTLGGCSMETVERASLPENDFLIIAHRGASAYAPDHTFPAYELAVAMGADYIEIDLHMTKDKQLVALHDKSIILDGEEHAISNLTFEELQSFLPGKIFNEQLPVMASKSFESLLVPTLEDILLHFKDEVNYYIEIKAPTVTPGIEKELIHQLQSYQLLNRSDQIPKVIIQSYNADSLKKVFELAPSIPLVKLYSQDTTSISKGAIRDLEKYASGVGVDQSLVTLDFVNRLHEKGLAIHPFVVNEVDDIQTILEMGADGIFTDNPDIALELKKTLNREPAKP